MGGLFGGGNKGKSESGNKAYSFIRDEYGPSGASAFNSGVGGIQDILLGNDPTALKNFWNSAGGQFQLDQGLDALTSKFSANGLRQSGAAMKGMETFRQGLADTYLTNFLGRMSDLSRLGLGAGGLVAEAGQYSKGQQSGGGGGLGGFLGALLACDARLKDNIERIGTLPDGLPLYEFDYLPGHGLPEGRHVGPMAHEVAHYQPDALGPKINGFATVDPAKLKPLQEFL